jgi:hypothetical protein
VEDPPAVVVAVVDQSLPVLAVVVAVPMVADLE